MGPTTAYLRTAVKPAHSASLFPLGTAATAPAKAAAMPHSTKACGWLLTVDINEEVHVIFSSLVGSQATVERRIRHLEQKQVLTATATG